MMCLNMTEYFWPETFLFLAILLLQNMIINEVSLFFGRYMRLLFDNTYIILIVFGCFYVNERWKIKL